MRVLLVDEVHVAIVAALRACTVQLELKVTAALPGLYSSTNSSLLPLSPRVCTWLISSGMLAQVPFEHAPVAQSAPVAHCKPTPQPRQNAPPQSTSLSSKSTMPSKQESHGPVAGASKLLAKRSQTGSADAARAPKSIAADSAASRKPHRAVPVMGIVSFG